MNNYTWENMLFTADQLIQTGKLTESQIKIILPLVELKKVVKYNKLSINFIKNNIEPLIDENKDDEDNDSLTINDIYRIQRYNYS
jgi:hypothetical protein